MLAAQKAVIEMVRPGESFMALHERAVEVVTDGLIDLGLLAGERREGHRDEATTGGSSCTAPATGSAWTSTTSAATASATSGGGSSRGWSSRSSPASTSQPGAEGAGEEYYNIGVRIEDDVLVTEDGCEVLTGLAPKEVKDVEATMRESLQLAV